MLETLVLAITLIKAEVLDIPLVLGSMFYWKWSMNLSYLGPQASVDKCISQKVLEFVLTRFNYCIYSKHGIYRGRI